MTRPRFLALLALAISTAPVPTGSALAHDYWLSPESFTLAVGDTCTVHLLVGDRLDPEIERYLQKSITTRYEWLTRGSSRDLLTALPDSTLPVLSFPVEREETALLVMDRDYVLIESTYGSFREFLVHEENGELLKQIDTEPDDKPMHRRYVRNLKALLYLGSGDSDGWHDHKTGQTLEILILQDPLKLKIGESLKIKVLFNDEPLTHELVRVFVADQDQLVAEEKARTDSEGVALVPVEHSGLYVVRVGHILRCQGCDEADWDTYYATFSFVYPGPAVR